MARAYPRTRANVEAITVAALIGGAIWVLFQSQGCQQDGQSAAPVASESEAAVAVVPPPDDAPEREHRVDVDEINAILSEMKSEEPAPFSARDAADAAFWTIKRPHYWGISIDMLNDGMGYMQNPHGEGFIVWFTKTRWLDQDIERHFCWLVLTEDEVFPINGATKNLNPDLPWYRNASPDVWQRAGMDRIMPTSDILHLAFPDDF